MGAGHVRTVAEGVPGADVVAVSDADVARAAGLAAEVGAEVLESRALIESVDAVIVASPDPTHPALAIACIEAGKSVLMEKPLAPDPAGAWSVVEAERAAGGNLVSVGFMRRFDPPHTAIKAASGPEGLGRPVLFRGIHRNPERSPYADLRSTVCSSGIHDIDSARWLMGEFISVSAAGRSVLGDGLNDLVHIQGEHVGGGLSTIEVYVSCVYGYEVSAELVCERGVATTLDPDRATFRSFNRRGANVPGDWLGRFDEAYRLELIAWVRSCVQGSPFPGATAFDGYRDQVVAEAVLQAIATGDTVGVEP